MSNITEEVCKDHKALADDYRKIQEATDVDLATRWQNQFIWALVRHLLAKEQVLFPAFEKRLGDRGKFIVDKDRFQYRSVGHQFKHRPVLTRTDQGEAEKVSSHERS